MCLDTFSHAVTGCADLRTSSDHQNFGFTGLYEDTVVDNSQYSLIRPYIESIFSYSGDISQGFDLFFMRQLKSVLAVVEEKEEIPYWVLDEANYKKKCEVLIATRLFEAVLRKFSEQKIGIPMYTKIYKDLIQFGSDRKWNLGLFRYYTYKQFTYYHFNVVDKISS